MGRMANLSPLGLYEWDNTIFDLMSIPSEMDKETLVQNLLAETAELEVLYPNPTVFKNLVGIWSQKELDVWNRLYATTQYEYNPIENYNRTEEGTDTGEAEKKNKVVSIGATAEKQTGADTNTGSSTLSGSDTVADHEVEGGTETLAKHEVEGGTETLAKHEVEGGTETLAKHEVEGGTETLAKHEVDGGEETLAKHYGESGSDTTTGNKTSGHWIAGFDSAPVGESDGLVKQTRDEDDTSATTNYGKVIDETDKTTFGKTVDDTGTTTFGKTVDDTDTTTFGKTVDDTDTTTFGKTVDDTDTTTFGKTVDNTETTTYGKKENTTGRTDYGKNIDTQTNGTTEGTETTKNSGGHTLHAYGNIGTMTTQDMIKQQRQIERFNMYDIIIESFKMRFCILVY